VNRRQLGGLAAGAAIAGVPLVGGCSADTASATGTPRPSDATGNCGSGVRRYVVGTGSDGKSYIQSHDCVSVDQQFGDTGPGVLWVTDTMPVDNTAPVTAAGAPNSGVGPFKTMPGPGGTVFSFIYSAHGDTLAPPMPTQLPTGFPAGGAPAGASGMHRTNSLDYWVILDGEITLSTEHSKIDLRPGDTVVVRGANHSWVKKTDKPFLAITVSVYAKPQTA
jgi:hypothetical protein